MPNFALFSQSGEYSYAQLSELASALTDQIESQVFPWWNHNTVVQAFPSKPPEEYWKLQIESNIGDPSAAGFHSDDNNQPYAVIQYTGNWDDDCVTVSHECIEMLLDPSGNWLAAPVPLALIAGIAVTGIMVRVLIEACDPCESVSYKLNSISVSDFTLPGYFRSNVPGARATFKNSCRSLQVGSGGYVSWLNLSDNHWYQLVDGQGISDLGPNDKKARGGMSIREWIDGFTRIRKAQKR